ncbi:MULTISPECIES: P63C domain-containing protein [Myxococcus]|nr:MULTISPECIES: P63C domain-containing protein [Myxococcus]
MFEDTTPVRVVFGENGEPWFVATDVCSALAISNSRMAVSRLDKDERNTVNIADGNRVNPNVTVISEAGVYRLVFTSRVDGAERFKRWLAHEVLPTIRKTGAYGVPMAAIRQAVAERFLGVGLAPYAKRFPTPFYEGIFRLRGWPWHGPGTPRPGVIASWTNDLVYERLAPELLRLLRERNPMDRDTGRRAAKHHQLLSEDIGHPALAGHLHSVLCIMRSCATWDDFMMQMDRIHPRWGNNLLLPLPVAEDMRLLPEQF